MQNAERGWASTTKKDEKLYSEGELKESLKWCGGGGVRGVGRGGTPFGHTYKQGEGNGQHMVETQLLIEAYYIGRVYIEIISYVSS
jgi:hypothetical protein